MELKARSSGKFIFIELEIETNFKDLEKAHQLSDTIENKIKSEIKNVDRVIIHIDPEKKGFIRYAVPCIENIGIKSRISSHFGEAEYFCIFDLQTDNNTLLEIRFIKNPFITLESPFYVMDDACVESEVTDFDTIEMIIQD
jgi:hypothetical protein